MRLSRKEIAKIHLKIKRLKGKPKHCEICYDSKVRLELSNINHKYSENQNDYWYLCPSCHALFDYLKGIRNGFMRREEYIEYLESSLLPFKKNQELREEQILSEKEFCKEHNFDYNEFKTWGEKKVIKK